MSFIVKTHWNRILPCNNVILSCWCKHNRRIEHLQRTTFLALKLPIQVPDISMSFPKLTLMYRCSISSGTNLNGTKLLFEHGINFIPLKKVAWHLPDSFIAQSSILFHKLENNLMSLPNLLQKRQFFFTFLPAPVAAPGKSTALVPSRDLEVSLQLQFSYSDRN